MDLVAVLETANIDQRWFRNGLDIIEKQRVPRRFVLQRWVSVSLPGR